MRILFISPGLKKGGMQKQLMLFLTGFDRSKLQVSLALMSNQIEYEIPNDVDLIFIKRSKFKVPNHLRLLRILFSADYDLVISRLSGLNELLMIYSGILRTTNLVLEIRNSGANIYPYFRKMNCLMTISHKHWPIIFNSKKALSEWKAIRDPYSKPLKYIPNGIDTYQFLKKEDRYKSDKFVVGLVGHFKPFKNYEFMLNVFSEFQKKKRNSELLILGEIVDKRYYQEIKTQVSSLNLQDNVKIIHGASDLSYYYSGMNIFVLGSKAEGTPNVLLEAMSCECVCLCSEDANSDQYIGREFTFPLNEPQILVDKIVTLSSLDINKTQAIGRNNRKFISENYSIKKMVDEYTDHFSSLLNIIEL